MKIWGFHTASIYDRNEYMTKITSLEFTVSIFSVTNLDKERTRLSELCLQEKMEMINYFTSKKLFGIYQLILLSILIANRNTS